MENAIIIRSNGQFKSKALNTATAGLAKAFSNIENGRKDACAILARVERNKSYTDDGFKSLAEYAETIGLNKSLAHKMENAGRLLISENETVKSFAKDADFSKLAILSSAGEDAIQAAIDSGDLHAGMTQKDVKELKASMDAKNAKKDKVLPELAITVFDAMTREVLKYRDVEIRDFDSLMKISDCYKIGTVAGIGLYEGEDFEKDVDGNPLDQSRKWEVYQCKYDFRVMYVTKAKAKAEKKAKVKSVKNMTREELLAALAALDQSETEE